MKDKTKLILLTIGLISLVIAYFTVNSNIEKSKIPQFIPIEYQNENGDTFIGNYDLSREGCVKVYETYNKLDQKIPLFQRYFYETYNKVDKKMPLKALRECLLIGVG